MHGLSWDLHAHIASLRRYALALSGNPSDADDLVQEALRRAIGHARKGGEVRNPRAFLFTVLHNVWANEQKRKWSNGQHVSLEDVSGQLRTEGNQQPRAELRALALALGELPADQRQVVLLVCVEGFAYRETAEMLGIPIGTVMSRLSRGRRSLIEKMTAETAGTDPRGDGSSSAGRAGSKARRPDAGRRRNSWASGGGQVGRGPAR